MSDNIPQTVGATLPRPAWLKEVRRPKKQARMITITGEAGLGKSAMAAMFPKPIFVPVEVSEATLERYSDKVALWPTISTTNDVIEALNALITDDHPFQTVVIDTVSRLYFMRESEIVAKYKGTSINTVNGGYGAGYREIAEFMRKLRVLCAGLIYKGIHVVFIAHTEVENFQPPIGDKYNRYVLKMHEDSAVPFVDDVDCVAFIKLSTIVSKEDKNDKMGHAMTTGERIISCTPNPAHPITKNRFDIETDLPYPKNTNPLEKWL